MPTAAQKKIVKKWVTALRSGKYKQGVSALHTVPKNGGNKYCCLGVLCDLAMKAGITKRTKELVGSVYFYKYDKESVFLPDSVRDWVGLATYGGLYGPDMRYSLTEINDNGKSFNYIANRIEAMPKGLFE